MKNKGEENKTKVNEEKHDRLPNSNRHISLRKIVLAALKFVPQSDVNRLTPGRRDANLTMALIIEPASSLYTSSVWTERVERHVKTAIQIL